ncbi:MAG: radical SAM protein [Candidatus Hydrothermarchaeaceae archaeon]
MKYTSELPRGCQLCEEGAKLVLFVTGVCDKHCVYCPLSEKRRGKDTSWANERPVGAVEDIIEEAHRMRARGAGITGGEPLLRFDRTLDYMRLLKGEFGGDFHLHLYTTRVLKKSELVALKEAGLDEIRFHLMWDGLWGSVERAVEVGLSAGIEIPALPSQEAWIIQIAEKLKETGGDFMNLNELEMADGCGGIVNSGLRTRSDESYGVEGSEETALKVLESGLDFNVHYCSSSFKDGVQLRNRLKRTAENIAREFDEVTHEGLLFKGVVELEEPSRDALALLQWRLVEAFEIPPDLFILDEGKLRLETSPEIAVYLSEANVEEGVRYSLVEEYPTWDRLEVSKMPIA